jgi:hypothetical protein
MASLQHCFVIGDGSAGSRPADRLSVETALHPSCTGTTGADRMPVAAPVGRRMHEAQRSCVIPGSGSGTW